MAACGMEEKLDGPAPGSVVVQIAEPAHVPDAAVNGGGANLQLRYDTLNWAAETNLTLQDVYQSLQAELDARISPVRLAMSPRVPMLHRGPPVQDEIRVLCRGESPPSFDERSAKLAEAHMDVDELDRLKSFNRYFRFRTTYSPVWLRDEFLNASKVTLLPRLR